MNDRGASRAAVLVMEAAATQPPSLACDAPSPGVASRLAARAAAVWRSRGFWAMGDQGVLSLGNFATNILLARAWKDEPALFGIYGLVFGIVLLLNSLHAAVVTYPLTVRAAGREDDDVRKLAAASWTFTLCLAPLMTLGLLAATGAAHRFTLLPAALAALVLWQVQETLRRTFFARLAPRAALAGDAVKNLGQVLLIWLLIRAGRLTPETAFAAIAASAALAMVIQAIQLRVIAAPAARARDAARDGWTLGRWLLLTSVVGAGTLYAAPWSLQAFRGPADVARFNALAQILGVTNPVMVSIGAMIVPAVAVARLTGGPAAGLRAAMPYALQGAALLAPFFALLAMAPGWVLHKFYGDSPYVVLGAELRVFALGYAIFYVGHVCTGVMNGLGRGRGTFLATAAGAGANVAIMVPMVYAYGLRGSVWGGIVPLIGHSAVAVALTWRAVSRGAGVGPTPESAEAEA